MEKPIIDGAIADNGNHSHWRLIDVETGELLWSEDPEEDAVLGYYVKDDWNVFDFDIIETRPKEYGKYFVCRKDGKIHWETWNGSGWAYNGKVITHWKEIKKPNK